MEGEREGKSNQIRIEAGALTSNLKHMHRKGKMGGKRKRRQTTETHIKRQHVNDDGSFGQQDGLTQEPEQTRWTVCHHSAQVSDM